MTNAVSTAAPTGLWSPELVSELFTDAHTTHYFTDEPVDPAEVAEVYEAIRWAPTAMNTQPLRITMLESSEAREKVAAVMSRGNREKTLIAPLSLVAAYDPNFHRYLDVLAPDKPGQFEKMDGDPDFRHAMAVQSANIQLGYLILGLRARGFVVNPMTGFSKGKTDEIVHAENGWKSIAMINIGHAADTENSESVRERAGRLDADTAIQRL